MTFRSMRFSPRTARMGAACAVSFALFTGGPALAYSPKWLACSGDITVTPTGAAPSKQAANDIYVYDDDSKNFFQYVSASKAMGYIGTSRYTDKEIAWTGESRSTGDYARWDGRLDRATMNLQLNYKSDSETRVWSEQCKPTTPREEAAPKPSK